MSKKVIIGILTLFVLITLGILVYILRPVAEASAPIEALPIEVEQEKLSAPGDLTSGVQDTPVTMDEKSSIVFLIVQEESEVRFTLDEILRGNPTTVVGMTNQVAGEIEIDLNEPGRSRVGTILVNARTLVTDNDFRNRAINNEILDTGEYEFITFTPTAIIGFPENPQVGETLTFQIAGNLTIRDITREVTFDVTVVPESEIRLSGYASAMIVRADYELNIPEVSGVADVDTEVLLEIEFVAVPE